MKGSCEPATLESQVEYSTTEPKPLLQVCKSYTRVVYDIFRYSMRKMRFYTFYNFLKSLLRPLYRKISFDTRAKDDSRINTFALVSKYTMSKNTCQIILKEE